MLHKILGWSWESVGADIPNINNKHYQHNHPLERSAT